MLDWEHAFYGDPAYDLAIVTRGRREPIELVRLVETYKAKGGTALKASDVRLYELCLVTQWYRDAREGRGSPQDVVSRLGQMKNVLRMAHADDKKPR